jgi:hypothetical protein
MRLPRVRPLNRHQFLILAMAVSYLIHIVWGVIDINFFGSLNDRRHDRDRQAEQFCRAIPNTAAASAQALVNILVADARRRGVPEREVKQTITLGALYVVEARRLANRDLPECLTILANASKEG